jgi:hypothetical protein
MLKIPTVLLGTALLATSCAGSVGSVGSQGPAGPQGPVGPAGLQGTIGATGAQGPVGPQGPAGPQGPSGEQGPRGFSGSNGAPGATGSNGLNGKSAFQIYTDIYTGYASLYPNSSSLERTWINDLSSANLDKLLTITSANNEDSNITNFSSLLNSLKTFVLSFNSYTMPTDIYLGQILSQTAITDLLNYPDGINVDGIYTDAGKTVLISNQFVVDSNETFYTKRSASINYSHYYNSKGTIAKAVVSSGASNETELNNAITTMWSAVYKQSSNTLFSTGVIDATKVTQDYVDKMNTAISGGTLQAVTIPIELVTGGKTFESAEVAFTDDNNQLTNYSPTDAIKVETNWNNKLILFANTNQAFGWTRTNGRVVYSYRVKWTDNTYTYFPIEFLDGDTGLFAKAVVSSGASNQTELNNAITTMWNASFDSSTNTFDAAQVTQDYVDKMNTAVANGTLSAVTIPIELVVPTGKTFKSAKVAFNLREKTDGTVGDGGTEFGSSDYSRIGRIENLNYVDADNVLIDPNWNNKLILFANTNQAYGWTRSNNLVTYSYKITWSDDTFEIFLLTFKDAG